MPTTQALPDLTQLMEAARRQSGLDNFGAMDFTEGLQRLLGSLSSEARLSEVGVMAQTQHLTDLLANRLRLHEALERNPEILDEPIAGPLVILGLPRTGTTKLQRLLARDPQLQTLPLWKILNPAPLAPIAAGQPETRIQIAEGFTAMLRERAPGFQAAHPMDAMEPDEEEFLMELSFKSVLTFHMARVPSYQAWVLQQDFHDWYAYLRAILQYQQWLDGARSQPWLLKTPSHMGHLDALFEVFPQAVVLHCHRDPLEVIPSFVALVGIGRRLYSDTVDAAEVDHFVIDVWARQTELYMDRRPHWEARGKRFIDVPYKTLMSDSKRTIESIYSGAGLALADAARVRMTDWETHNPQHKYGRHAYSLSDRSDLTPAVIRQAFDRYCQRFLNGDT